MYLVTYVGPQASGVETANGQFRFLPGKEVEIPDDLAEGFKENENFKVVKKKGASSNEGGEK